MTRFKLLIARSTERAEELIRILGLDETWRGVGFFGGLAGLPVEKIVVFDFRDMHVDVDRADEWLNKVARLRLLPGCQNNVWSA